MASKVDSLLSAYQQVLTEPWNSSLSGRERVWFLIYDPAEQRRVDLRLGDFDLATQRAGRRWLPVSLRTCFAEWMASHKYRDSYFARPNALLTQLEVNFREYAVQYLRQKIEAGSPDTQTMVVLRDAGALFGFARLNEVVEAIAHLCPGRLMVLFPGEYHHNNYRLLDSRDGWNYLARPITG